MITEVLDKIPKNSMLKEELLSNLNDIPNSFLHENIVLAKSGGSYYMLKRIGSESKYILTKMSNSQSTMYEEPRTIAEVKDDIQRNMFQEILVLNGVKDLVRVLSGEYRNGR